MQKGCDAEAQEMHDLSWIMKTDILLQRKSRQKVQCQEWSK